MSLFSFWSFCTAMLMVLVQKVSIINGRKAPKVPVYKPYDLDASCSITSKSVTSMREELKECHKNYTEHYKIDLDDYYTQKRAFCCLVFQTFETCEKSIFRECNETLVAKNHAITYNMFGKTCQRFDYCLDHSENNDDNNDDGSLIIFGSLFLGGLLLLCLGCFCAYRSGVFNKKNRIENQEYFEHQEYVVKPPNENAVDSAFHKLGIPVDSSPEVVRQKFRALSLKYHPDKNPSVDTTSKFQELNIAYQTIMETWKD